MKNQQLRWTAGIVLALAFAVSGCEDNKISGKTSQSQVENAPALQAGRPAPDATPAPESKENQSPSSSAVEKEQRPAG